MVRLFPLPFIAIALTACENNASSRPSALPENVKDDKPIVLKEGQAVALMIEGNSDLLIAASVVDGKLSIGEVAFDSRSLEVTWTDDDSWRTATMTSEGEDHSVVMDQDGDGLPEFRAVKEDGTFKRFELAEPEWIEVAPKSKDREESE